MFRLVNIFGKRKCDDRFGSAKKPHSRKQGGKTKNAGHYSRPEQSAYKIQCGDKQQEAPGQRRDQSHGTNNDAESFARLHAIFPF
jgi:hypothetical protein